MDTKTILIIAGLGIGGFIAWSYFIDSEEETGNNFTNFTKPTNKEDQRIKSIYDPRYSNYKAINTAINALFFNNIHH